jgi:argininosuccinate lyase
MTPDTGRLRRAAGAGHATATDLADWLVRALGLPFREAHHVTGALVAAADARSGDLADLSLQEMQAIHPGINPEVYQVLGVDNSVASRASYGGTAPVRVRAQVERWTQILS